MDHEMEYVKLGNSGLDVSRICLGCMGFGISKESLHWAIEETESLKILKQANDLGINFFDTGNEYSTEESEKILGFFINKNNLRDKVVIATKVHQKNPNKPNCSGLSRKYINTQVNRSLENLKMDYIDLLIIHKWDYHTPIEETMSALDDLVKSGKVHYIGASSMYAWQLSKAMYTAQSHGWTKFISMQNHYNLLYREEEREMMPLCRDLNIAMTPYSPLPEDQFTSGWSPDTSSEKIDIIEQKDRAVIKEIEELAKNKRLKISQLTLAWLLHKNPVASTLIGATKKNHLDDAVRSLKIKLSEAEITLLEKAYVPHNIIRNLN